MAAEAAAVKEESPKKGDLPSVAIANQLKEFREGYAKECEDKMLRGFEEINELKKDMVKQQQVYET